MIDPHRCDGSNDRLCMHRNAKPRCLQHPEIVGPVSHGNCRRRVTHQCFQCVDFCFCAKYRPGNITGQNSIALDQLICSGFMKTEKSSNPVGELDKSAGDERRTGTILSHCANKNHPAAGQSDACLDYFVDDGRWKPTQESNTFDQGFFEIQLAVHGKGSDLGDAVSDAGFGGKFIDAFLIDHGGIHIGDQKLLSTTRSRKAVHVHAHVRKLGPDFGKVSRSLFNQELGRFTS